MKTRQLIIGSAGLLLIALVGLVVSLPAQEKKAGVSSGKAVYEKKCASCHGKQGEGNPKVAKALKSTIRNFAQIVATPDTLAAWKKLTLEGKGKMPAYKGKLSEPEVDSVLAYLRLIAKPASAPKDSGSAKGTKPSR